MGKKKSGKKKNVFKVAGAKSLKPKIKAKVFAGNLKKIKETLKDNISEIDKNLVILENDVRRKKVTNKTCKDLKKNEKPALDSATLEADRATTLKKLSKMSF